MRIDPHELVEYFRRKGLPIHFREEDGMFLFFSPTENVTDLILSVSVAGSVVHLYRDNKTHLKILECLKEKLKAWSIDEVKEILGERLEFVRGHNSVVPACKYDYMVLSYPCWRETEEEALKKTYEVFEKLLKCIKAYKK